MARSTSQTVGEDHNDLNKIFIGRERQLEDFKVFLARWQERMAQTGPDDMPEPAVPTPNNKIQGLVVMLYGRGGFGKSTLLRRYRNIALDTNQQGGKLHVGGIVDWEFAVEGKRGLFNPPKGQPIDPVEYCKALAKELAPKLDKQPDACKHLQRALQDVGKAQKEAHHTLESMQQDDRYGWLRGLAIEGVTTLVRAHVPAITLVLDDPIVKNATDEAAKLTQEQLTHLLVRLRDRLNKDTLNDYLNPGARLGLALGADLRDWARNYPLFIYFDTYEEIDEGDGLLRTVMGAAGPRVGWVLAGRDNLWGGISQIERNIALEYGYKDLVPSDRGLSINFDASDVGAFSPADITVYFALLQEKIPDAASLPPLSESDAKRIWDVTQGVPLAVNIATAIYRESKSMDAVTEKVEGKKEIVDQMVRRYLLHTRSNQIERHKLYGLAMLRRADQPSTIAAALGLTQEKAETDYRSELSHLHRRYSFIFTEKDIPALHQEVRHFLRRYLLERRTEPEIVVVNKRLLVAQEKALKDLEELREYTTLKERLQDDQWVDAYLDLTEQQFWSDPVQGVKYILPFMIAAAIYRREANKDATEIGEFFEAHVSLPYRNRWQWANQSLASRLSSSISAAEKIRGLEELERLAQQRCPTFPAPLPNYQAELKAAIWWRLGEAYTGKDKALEWYEKALAILKQETELREAAAEVYFNVAYALSKEKKHAEVVNQLTKTIELNPGYVFAYNNRGNAYNELKKYEEAMEDLNLAIMLDPKNAIAYNNRGYTYSNRKEYEQAIADYSQAIALDPNFSFVYYNRGYVYNELDKYEEAIADYTQAITYDPNFANAYNNRGWVYRQLKEYGRAIANHTQAIALDPKFALAYNNRGIAYTYLKEYERAIADYSQAIVLDPDFATAYTNRGNAYDELKEYERAIADYSQAIALDPNHAFAYYNRGITYKNLKEYEQAVADYSQSIAYDPNYAFTYYNRGNAYANLKKYERAIADYSQAIALDPNYAKAYNNRGLALLWLHNLTQASADYNSAYKLNPKNINAVWAWLWTDIGKQRPSVEVAAQLERIAEIDAEHYVAYICRGLALGLRGELLKGLEELEKAIPIKPEEWDAYFWKGMLCAYRGRHSMAMEAIEKSLELGLPPVLLTSLYWLKTDRPDFFAQYAQPLLEQYGV